jgi:hypothetical protein
MTQAPNLKKALQFAGKVFLELSTEDLSGGPALKLLNVIADKGLQVIL